MERVLVTGGAGFIGSHLCDRLIGDGCDVICLDNYFTGSKDNVRHLLGNDRFELVRHDVTTPFYAEVDRIYNLACPASPVNYQYNPIKTLKTSIYGALNMLGMAKRVGATILHASTSEVYGDPTIHPQVESYWGNVNPIGIRSCYDEGKRAAETLALNSAKRDKEQNNTVQVGRISQCIGPYMPLSEAAGADFIANALDGKNITMRTNGLSRRAFTYISDAVAALFFIALKGENGDVYNVNAMQNYITVRELAELVVNAVSGRNLRVVVDPDMNKLEVPEMNGICLDTAKLERLGWKAVIPPDEMVRRTIEFYTGYYNDRI